MEPLLLGIDVGTSVAKAVVFDRKGNVVSAAHRIPRLIHPEVGWSEADMEALWQDVLAVVAEALAKPGVTPSAVRGLGVSGTCCSSWLLDEEGRPVRNAILWNDGRAAGIVREWHESGLMDELFAVSGNVVFPGYTVAVLRWLKENEPQTLERARHSVFCKDWIRYRLTGEIAAEHTDASAVPYDIREGRFSEEVFTACGVPEALSLLSPPRDPGDVAGHLLPEVARTVGLPSGLPVIAGMMDVAATTLGTGAIRAGQACSIVGTSFLNCFLLDRPGFEPPGVGVQMRTAGNVWLRAMVNTAGTINLDWFLDRLCPAERANPELAGAGIYRWAEAQAASVPVGADGLIYHPYLSNAGVVSPFFHPAARAQFFGLSVDHTRAHMLRAVYEGVALSMRDCVTAIPDAVDEWFMAGGGSRSDFWCQMFADCTGKTILVPEGEEFGARGVAMLAGIATGVYGNVADAAAKVSRVRRRFEPDSRLTERYARLHEVYKGVHRHLQEDWWDRFNMLDEFAKTTTKPA